MPLRLLSAPFFEFDGFPIAVRRMPSQDACPPHTHDFHELVVVTGGTGTHLVDGRRVLVGAGSIFRVEPGTIHSYESVESLSLTNILFLPAELPLGEGGSNPCLVGCSGQRPGSLPRAGWLEAESLAEAGRHIDQMEHELAVRGPCYRYAVVNHLRMLLLAAARAVGAGGGMRHNDSPAEAMQAQLRVALNHMHTQYAEPLDVDALAVRVGMSPRNFRRNFHKVTGLSPVAYLARVRVQEAAMRLRDPAATVTRVAFDVGFNDLSFFDRRFKAFIGETPHDFRVRMRSVCPNPSPVQLYPAREDSGRLTPATSASRPG